MNHWMHVHADDMALFVLGVMVGQLLEMLRS